MDAQIREIKRQFRMAMNGIVSTSMREKGMDYKINFGLTLPFIKRIAEKYCSSAKLAELLWKENIRESKILATLLYPAQELTPEIMQHWADTIVYREIADMCCMNLFDKVPFALDKALKWISSDNEMLRYTGFQLIARLAMTQNVFTAEVPICIMDIINTNAGSFSTTTLHAAINCVKRILQIDRPTALTIKTAIESWKNHSPLNKSIAEDIMDEFCFLYSEPIV